MQFDVIDGLVWYGVFTLSTVCHEASHAWTELRLGDHTAERGGQVSLNPWPHIRREPLGLVAVPLLTWIFFHWMFGWASTPFNPTWARHYPRRAAIMAMAGPSTNLLIASLGAGLLRVGLACDVFSAPAAIVHGELAIANGGSGFWAVAALVVSIMISLNLLLCVINLLPFSPLDGAAIPVFFLPERTARKYLAAVHGPVVRYAGLLVIPWVISPLFNGLARLAARVLYPHTHFV